MTNNFARICKKCEQVVSKSEDPSYPYQCLGCDEDLLEFETRLENKELIKTK